MKYFSPILELIHSFMGMIILLWAYARPASSSMKKIAGIRLTADAEYSADHGSHLNEVCEAMLLLERVDIESFELIKKHIRVIFLLSIGVECTYLPIGKICILNLTGKSDEDKLIKIAGFLVSCATYSRLSGPIKFYLSQHQENAKRVSQVEKRRVIEKLKAATTHPA